jgi:hypothetical protein
MLRGGEVIADALVSGMPGIGVGVDNGSLPSQATFSITSTDDKRINLTSFKFMQATS